MNRRDTIAALLALGAAVSPRGGRAQSKTAEQSRKLGVLAPISTRDAEGLWLNVLRAELGSFAWIEGRNLVLEPAFADYNSQRLPALAEQLVRKRVDVVWAVSGESAVAAARATRSVPIVFVAVPWPVETGLIDSFARPGRNVTGVSSYSGIEVSTKRLEFLKEMAPTATRLSWILDADMAATVDGGHFDARPLLDTEARRLGYDVRYHMVGKQADLDAAFADILQWKAHAIAVAGSATTYAARDRIADFALRHRLPSSCASASNVDSGALFSYNTAGDLAANVKGSVEYVDRIFRGARPSDLPVSRPNRYALVIKLRTAAALGLAISPSLRQRADRVIE